MRLFERELQADHDCKYKTPNLITILPLEEQFSFIHPTCFINCKMNSKKIMGLQHTIFTRQEDYVIYNVKDIGDEKLC